MHKVRKSNSIRRRTQAKQRSPSFADKKHKRQIKSRAKVYHDVSYRINWPAAPCKI